MNSNSFRRTWIALTLIMLAWSRAAADGPAVLEAYPAAVGQISLKWTDNSSSETGYRVQRSSDGQTWSQIGSDLAANTTTFNDTTATAKQRYYYRVGALGAGGSVVWSNTANAFAVYTGGPLSDWIDVTDGSKIDCTKCPSLQCPAVPNSGADVTCALQQDLNLISTSTHPNDPHVLYFPNGTYKISQTLYLGYQKGPELIGQSAGGVVIQWDRNAGGNSSNIGSMDPCTGIVTPKVMFHAANNYHLVVSNLVFDGARLVHFDTYVVAFDLSACAPGDNACLGLTNQWSTVTPITGFVDSGTGIFDSIFRNAWIGLRISHFNYQDSELSVRRSQFLSNQFGTSVEDFNALQLNFWDCKWDNNRARGITNYIRNFGGTDNNWEGDFTVDRGRFTNNGQDVYYNPGGQYRVRDSWSRGSGMFIFGHGETAGSTQITVSNNYVDAISPSRVLDDYDSMAWGDLPDCRTYVGMDLERGRVIANENAGALVMFDNKFDPRSTTDSWVTNPANAVQVAATAEPIFANSYVPSAILALSNRFTVAEPYEQTGVNLKQTPPRQPPPTPYPNDLTSQAPLALPIPALPVPVDILAGHQVFTVTDVNNAQDVINAAVSAAQAVPVAIHFPTNEYQLTSTLTIPAVPNDLVITGSGTSTNLLWSGAGTGPMMKLGGYHTKTTLRDLSFYATSPDGTHRASGLVLDDVNAASTRLFMNRVAVVTPHAITPGNPVTGGFDLDRVDLTKVDIFDLLSVGYMSSYPFAEYDDYLMKVTAGPQTQATKSIWSSSAGGSTRNFVGVNGPQGLNWLIAGSYMEGSKAFLKVSGSGGNGSVSVVGAKMATIRSSDTDTVRVDGFPGNVSVVSAVIFDDDPNVIYPPPFLAPTGAIIEQTGSGAVDIQSIGNTFTTDPGYSKDPAGTATFTRASDKVNACSEQNASPEYFTANGQSLTLGECCTLTLLGGGLATDRVQHSDDERGDLDMTDIGTFTDPASQGVVSLNAGLNLYRNTPVPGYYDEPGAEEPYQVNLDNVKIWSPISGVYVNGGPSAASLVSAVAASATQVNVAWTDNSSTEDGFKVRRATSSNGTYSDLSPNPGPNVTSFSDTTASEGNQYWYSVAAFRNATAESGATTSAPVTTPPNTPTNLSALQKGTNSLKLTWTDNSIIETGFPIQRATASGGPFTVVATASPKTGTGAWSFIDSNGLVEGTQYWYELAATNGQTTSPYAGPTSATTALNAPDGGSGTAVAGRDNRIQWNDNSLAEQDYRIERAVKSGNVCLSFSEIGTVGAVAGSESIFTYDDIGSGSNAPLAGTTYCYRARAHNPNAYSSYSAVVSVTTQN